MEHHLSAVERVKDEADAVFTSLGLHNRLCAGQKRKGNRVFLLSFDSLIFPLRSPSLSFRKLHGHSFCAGIRECRCQHFAYDGIHLLVRKKFHASYRKS